MGSLDDIVEFDLYTYEGSDKVQVSHGYMMMVASFIFFQIVNGLIVMVGPPKSMKSEVWRWRNTFVSWIHADFIGVAVIYGFLFRWQDMLKDMIIFCDWYTYSVVCLSLGYFVFDMWDHIINKKLLISWEVIIHHIGVIWSLLYCLHYRIIVGYNMLALLIEVNSIFLHGRKLLHLCKWPFKHWLYRLCIVLNLATFVVFRLAVVFCIGISGYLERKRLSFIFKLYLIVVMIAMYLINIILFWRLIKSDLLRNFNTYTSRSKLKSDENGHEDNGIENSSNHIH